MSEQLSSQQVRNLERLADEQLARLEEYAGEMRAMAYQRDALLAALGAAPSPLTGDDSEDMCYEYGLWFHGQRQAALKGG